MKMDILKYVTRKSPQHEDEELNVDGIVQVANNKIIVQECKYPSNSAGNSVNMANTATPKKEKLWNAGLLKFSRTQSPVSQHNENQRCMVQCMQEGQLFRTPNNSRHSSYMSWALWHGSACRR
jgi:hypothetical protein